MNSFASTGMKTVETDRVHALVNLNPQFLIDACIKCHLANVRIGHSIVKITLDTIDIFDSAWLLSAYIMGMWSEKYGKGENHLVNPVSANNTIVHVEVNDVSS
jgi:hypothetical protein